MATNEKKTKEINVGMTDELMDFLNKWMEKATDENKNKSESEQLGIEVKRAVAKMAMEQLEKLQKELDKISVTDAKWSEIIERIDRISDIVLFY